MKQFSSKLNAIKWNDYAWTLIKNVDNDSYWELILRSKKDPNNRRLPNHFCTRFSVGRWRGIPRRFIILCTHSEALYVNFSKHRKFLPAQNSRVYVPTATYYPEICLESDIRFIDNVIIMYYFLSPSRCPSALNPPVFSYREYTELSIWQSCMHTGI